MQKIIDIYQASLKANKIDFICLSNNYATVVGDYFDTEYVAELKNKKIKTREILPDTLGNREAAKNKNPKINQVRFLKSFEPSESDILFFDNKVFLISFDPQTPQVLEITDKNIAANLRNQFENLWDNLN